MNNLRVEPVKCNKICIGTIPTAYVECMSYLEQVMYLTKKVNEVIKTFNELVNEEVAEYINETFNDIMINTTYDDETETLVMYLENEGGN